jgi:hypothetical protein
VKFNPAALPGPTLASVPVERYEELRRLYQAIERRPAKPADLLCKVTRQLPEKIVTELLALLRAEDDDTEADDDLAPIQAALADVGGLRFVASMTEDAFLATAWLELADQALAEDEEPQPLGVLVALQPTRD